MIRTLLVFLLILGIVLSGLMLLRRTAGKPEDYKEYKRRETDDEEEDDY